MTFSISPPSSPQADQRFGGALDILVNNVGRSIRKASTFEFTPEEFADIIDTNFNSVLLLTQVPLRLNTYVVHTTYYTAYGFLCFLRALAMGAFVFMNPKQFFSFF